MAMAANMSPSTYFLAIGRKTVDVHGDVEYEQYHSFSNVTFVLIKLLAVLPFPEDIAVQIYAARMLMLFFLASAAVLAYLALCRLFFCRWCALTATLLSFSTRYVLYYSDSIFVEMPVLFGIMLTFHGMVIFVQEDRFRQLLIKACISALLGWQAFALLLPFVVFGLASEFWRAPYPRYRAFTSLVSRRYLMLSAVTLFVGLLVLSYSLAMDYYGSGGKGPIAELRTIQRALWRSGWVEWTPPWPMPEHTARMLELPNFLGLQFRRIVEMFIPFVFVVEGNPFENTSIGLGLLVVSMAGLALVPHRILVATLVLFGFFWSLPMRQHAIHHDIDSVFYVGIPLVFFSLGLLYARRWFGDRPIVLLSIFAAMLFMLSSYQMNNRLPSHAAGRIELERIVISDFDAIRKIAEEGAIIYIPKSGLNSSTLPPEIHSEIDYFLNGRFFVRDDYTNMVPDRGGPEIADFILTSERVDGPHLLTPSNRRIFLYRMED